MEKNKEHISGREITILIIEDEHLSRTMLAYINVAMGFRTLTAENGRAGRKIAVSSLPDLILLDITMPGEDGFQTCQKLKEEPVTKDIPIIFVSDKDNVESKVKGLSLGCWDYISKPYAAVEVEARVKNCLNLHFAHQQVVGEQARRLQQMHEAQQAILITPAEKPEACFAVYYLPVLEAGGDFYDVFSIAPGVHSYLVADVSGHGLGASFTTPALKALINQNASICNSPDETMRIMNKVLTSIFRGDQHLTAVYCTVNRNDNLLSLVNAGHLPMLFMPRDGGPYWLQPTSDILGAFVEAFFETKTIPVHPGDRLYLFSDGLIESFHEPLQTCYQGMEKLMTVAMVNRQLPIAEATKNMAQSFSPQAHHFDDDVLLMGVDI